MVLNSSCQLIACVGVENLVVVATKDHILICDKSRSQDVRKVLPLLGKKPAKSLR